MKIKGFSRQVAPVGSDMTEKKPTSFLLVPVFFLMALAAPCFSQEKTGDVVIGSTYSFTPKNFEGQVDICVHLPVGYEKSSEKYPVLYLLDTERDFVFGSAVADFLASNDRVPALVVVSVFLGNASGAPPQLISFLEDQVFPFIEGTTRVQPCRVLYGHSARSFATLFVLLYRPDLFYGYIGAGMGLTSPPWTTAVDFLQVSETRLAEMKTLKKSFFFVLGNEEPFYPAVRKFVEILKAKAPQDLDWKYENMPEDDHFSNKLKTLYFGLEHVFKGWSLPVEVAKNGPEAVKAHYARLSERLGYETGLPQPPIHRAVMNWLAYQNEVDIALALVKGLREKYDFDCGVSGADLQFAGLFAVNGSKFNDALKIYGFLCQEDPESPAGFAGLGEVHERTGKLDLARASYEKAVALAQAKNDPALKRYLDNLERLKAQK
jgi:predicted alpha/beta superfamily hydrolase